MNHFLYFALILLISCTILSGCASSTANITNDHAAIQGAGNPLPDTQPEIITLDDMPMLTAQEQAGDNAPYAGEDQPASQSADKSLGDIQPEASHQENALMINPENGDGSDIVDLTQLSSIMVYAEVYNMLAIPEDYMGKTIKMSGLYYASPYPEKDICYHFVIIQDATACCAEGLEFIWKGDHTYPEDYPADETLVEVTGIFDCYEEDGYTYLYIDAGSVIEL